MAGGVDGLGSGGDGVKIMTARRVNIEQSRIHGFIGTGINATNTMIGDVWVKDTRVSDGGTGIRLDGTAGAVRAVLNNVEIHHFTVGLEATHGAVVTARLSDFSLNFVGVDAVAGALVTLDSGTISFCNTGAQAIIGPGTTIRLTNMSILDNVNGLFVEPGSSIVSFNNNRFRGNTFDGTPTTTLFVK